MRDQHKTKTQLIGELTELRQCVVDLERVRDEQRRTEGELLAQRSLAVGLSATSDLNEALRLCLETAIKVSKMDCGGVYLVDKNSGGLDLKCSVALSDESVNAVSRYDKDSVNTRLVMEGRPIYRHDPILELPLSEVKLLEGLSSIAIIPIRHEEQVIGCMNVASRKFIDVPAFAQSTLETIAAQIGSAIARIRAAEERERLVEQAKMDREQLRSLTHKLVDLQEAERRNLAHELHDRFGQTITALGINLNIIRDQLPAEVAAKVNTWIRDSQELLEETTEHVRDVMAQLRPAVLDDFGLMAALRWYGDRFSKRTGITTILRGEELAARLPAEEEMMLFRIAQEILTNVVKHSQARGVTIEFWGNEEEIHLVIGDDGIGFDPAAQPRPGNRPSWGLITMRERAEAIGGQLRVETARGKGTKITVEILRKK